MRELPRGTRSGDGSGMLTLSELSGSVRETRGWETDLLVPREDHPASLSVLLQMTKSHECAGVYPVSYGIPFPEQLSQDLWSLCLKTGTMEPERAAEKGRGSFRGETTSLFLKLGYPKRCQAIG